MPLGIDIGQMRLVIKIRITWANKNILGYLPKYKSLLPPLAEQSGIQSYTMVLEQVSGWLVVRGRLP